MLDWDGGGRARSENGDSSSRSVVDGTAAGHDPVPYHTPGDKIHPLHHLYPYQELYFTNATGPDQGLRMMIILKRKVMSEMMTTFFPSVLLMLITFATTLYKEQYFEATLSVNLTTMLVMTTIFISKMESLPPTSETKMIDMWLILCQLVPFIEVILVTAVEFYREEPQPNKAKEETENTEGDSMSMILMEMYSGKKDQNFPKMKKNAVDTSDSENKTRREKIRIPFANIRKWTLVPYLHTIGECLLIENWKVKYHFSEKKIVPGFVVFLSVIYFGVAFYYYNDN